MTRTRQAASTKPHLVIVPRTGVGPVRFGMRRRDVRRGMAELGLSLSSAEKTLDFFGDENAIQVEYDGGTASFIGVSNGQHFTCSIYDVDPFDMLARKLFTLLAKHDGTTKGARFDPSEYCFRNTIVTLYEADKQYDHKGRGRRVIWSQVGVGDERYLAAIDALGT